MRHFRHRPRRRPVPPLPPGIELRTVGVHRSLLAVEVTVHRKSFKFLPALHSANRAMEVRCDRFPRLEHFLTVPADVQTICRRLRDTYGPGIIAIPFPCVELVRRRFGRSRWGERDQFHFRLLRQGLVTVVGTLTYFERDPVQRCETAKHELLGLGVPALDMRPVAGTAQGIPFRVRTTPDCIVLHKSSCDLLIKNLQPSRHATQWHKVFYPPS